MSIITNQLDTKSSYNHNHNPSTKQHVVSSKHSASRMTYVSREIHRRQCYCTVFYSVVIVTLPIEIAASLIPMYVLCMQTDPKIPVFAEPTTSVRSRRRRRLYARVSAVHCRVCCIGGRVGIKSLTASADSCGDISSPIDGSKYFLSDNVERVPQSNRPMFSFFSYMQNHRCRC